MTDDWDAQAQFAVDVVRRLRDAGYDALWAGGCVRDRILGLNPTDYDVATAARPEQVRQLFGRRQTREIGQAFGVVAVLGMPGGGMIEVATFRQDGPYSDGRHPDAVTFSDAEHDAQRRDFTINGLFYDPLADQVLDYVGGVDDIHQRQIRAIGDPQKRFAEDHLRLLRAPRFAARFQFEIEPVTLAAIQQTALLIRTVAAERIGNEMRWMLGHPQAATAFDWLLLTRLWQSIAPGLSHPAGGEQTLQQASAALDRLSPATFELALATLIRLLASDPRQAAAELTADWKLSNDEAAHIGWLVHNVSSFARAAQIDWPQFQPLLIHAWAEDALRLAAALWPGDPGAQRGLDYCRERLGWPPERLNPEPLIDGNDLHALGIPRGPVYRRILDSIRSAQLRGEIHTHADALRAAQQRDPRSQSWSDE